MGSSTPSTQNVVQSTQIPQYQQDYAIENENVARDIAARPFQQYQGQRIADLTDLQNRGIGIKSSIGQNPGYANYAGVAADATQGVLGSEYGGGPASYTAANTGAGAGHLPASAVYNGFSGTAAADSLGQSAGYNPFGGSAGAGHIGQAASYNASTGGANASSYLNAFGGLNPNSIPAWMSPYIEQALRPQIQDIQRQSALTARGINAGAAQAGAFGDARLGVQQGENDRNTNQLIANTVGTGYQNAYDRAVAASQGAFAANAGQFNTETAARNAAIRENSDINQQNNAAGLAAFQTNLGQFNTEDAAQRAAVLANAGINEQNNAGALRTFQTNAGQFNTEAAARLAAFAENANISRDNNAGYLAAFAQNAGQFNSEDAAQRAAIAENAAITQGNNQTGLATFAANAGQYNTDRARTLAAAGQLPGIAAGEYGISQQQADDLLSAGKLQQDQTQQGLSTAYQDFINQFQYPQEALNLRLATQQGSPYNTTRLTQTPYSPTAQNIGALASLFGFLGKPAGGTAA